MKIVFHTIFLFFISGNQLIAQKEFKELTIHITDSLQSKENRARALFEWVTNNISYDVKAFSKRNTLNQSAQKTLKRKKSLCEGYAELYKKLCESAGLECYVVHGYCKGFGYKAGDQFLRANHAWNVVKIDSAWILVDPTWGSGFLKRSPSFWDKFNAKLFKMRPVMSKNIFIKHPQPGYFNFQMGSLPYTHHSLDPKWQQSSYPVSMEGFLSNQSTSKSYRNFKEEVNKQKDKAEISQRLEEGEKGLLDNPLNNFDLGYANYNYAQNMVFSAVDHSGLSKIKQLFLFSDSLLAVHQRLTDSLFKSKMKYLKKREGSLDKYKKLNDKELKVYSKNTPRFYIRNNKKIRALKKRIERLDNLINQVNGIDFNSLSHVAKIKSSKEGIIRYTNSIVSLENAIADKQNFVKDIDKNNLQLIREGNEFNDSIKFLMSYLQMKTADLELALNHQTDNNEEWFRLWNNYSKNNSHLRMLFKKQVNSINICNSQFVQLLSIYSEVYNHHIQRINLFIKYNEMTGNMDETIGLINNEKKLLINMKSQMDISLSFGIKALRNQIDEFNKNRESFTFLEKSSFANADFLYHFNEYEIDDEALDHQAEITLVLSIRSQIKTDLAQIKEKQKYIKGHH